MPISAVQEMKSGIQRPHLPADVVAAERTEGAVVEPDLQVTPHRQAEHRLCQKDSEQVAVGDDQDRQRITREVVEE